MANSTFTVTVVDSWPKIKILCQQGTNVRDEGPVQYDIANTQFQPVVTDALRRAVEDVINQHRRK